MPESTTLPHLVRFGIYEVNLRAGELRRDGAKIKLQEQPFKILAMLIERPGEIVTREELEKALWSTDTFVDFEHGLNKAINKIREALDDSADNPRFVETLARRGYRFICPVAAASSPPASGDGDIAATAVGAGLAPPTRASVSRRTPLRRRWMMAATGGAVVAIVAALVALNVVGVRDRVFQAVGAVREPPLQIHSIAVPPLRAVPFTSFPGQENDPSFSPDGNQIAFAWNGEKEDNWDIYVKVIGTESVLRLTTNPADDLWPAWCPDGRYIAFFRHTTEGDNGIFVVAALGGPERKLHSTSGGGSVDWSPNGMYLAYTEVLTSQEHRSISMLSVEDPEERRMLTSPPRPFGLDFFPRFSPDGKAVAFARLLTTGQAHDIYVVPVSGGEPRRLTSDSTAVSGLTWTPDGKYIIFSSERLGGPRLWKIPASGGEPEALPVGQEDALDPALSRRGERLAYTRESVDTNIWRYEVSGGKGRTAAPTRLIASTAMDGSQQYSPDGKKIVFASTRSGHCCEIWVSESDGANPAQLTHFDGPQAGTPRWSPDGRLISFDFEPDRQLDVYVVSAEGGIPHRLTNEPSNETTSSWSRDGRWIYFASDRTGTWQVWKMPADGGQAVQITKKGGFAPFEAFDGTTLYYAKGVSVSGLWEVPVEGGGEAPVSKELSAAVWSNWGLTKDGIYFYNPETRAIELFSFATRRSTKVATPQREPRWTAPGFSVSPDGRWILFAQPDIVASDIMLVENFRW